MSETMRERIATAALDYMLEPARGPGGGWRIRHGDDIVIDGLQGDIGAARMALEGIVADAVLDALRDPTEPMTSAGIVERHDTGVPEAWHLATANIWRAMVDAAKAGA